MIEFLQKGKDSGDKILDVTEVGDESFNSTVIKSDCPVLVDFWAPWCGPCRMISSVVEEIAEEYTNVIKVVKLNTDENPSIATEYGIRSIPTLMLFIQGKKVDTVIGAVPKTTLATTLQKHLNDKKSRIKQ
uniref:Thioredoxin n=1 Tax=Riquetophycus sp. TaxID=1897556 RepID=A0A1C9C848_9FLOR|nr:thioredoxin [Riquetophycus sp.]